MRRAEEGSATVAVLGAIVAVLLIASLGLYLGVVYAQKVRAQAVADLSALAGAQSAPSALLVGAGNSAVPCVVAEQVATRNGMKVTFCQALDGDLRVRVRTLVPAIAGLGGVGMHVQGQARAGPEWGSD